MNPIKINTNNNLVNSVNTSLVIPTVFSQKIDEFSTKLHTLKSISSYIHIDFMDGKFVEKKSPLVKDIPDLSNNHIIYEAHLMYENPKKYVEDLIKKGCKKIIFHYESQENDHEILYMWLLIKKNHAIPVLALNPETNISVLDTLPFVDFVLLMGVHPGKEKQELILEVIDKITVLKKTKPSIIIQVDGGVNEETAFKLGKAGADKINSGSFVSSSENPFVALEKLQISFEKGRREYNSINKFVTNE